MLEKTVATSDSQSSYQSLRQLFEQDINVRHIAEPLVYFHVVDPILHIRDYMDYKDFDVVGMEQDGMVVGYLKREDLERLPFDLVHYFRPEEIVSDSTPLIQLLYLLKDKERLFILESNRITKIVTLADLQKPPIRMLFFGLITLLEMQLLHLITVYYPDGSWKKELSESRLADARFLFKERKKRNEEIQLLDCLQFCDKKTLIVKNKELRTLLDIPSKTKGESFFRELESLRNKLAHAQDLTMGTTWEKIIVLIEQCEQLLKICEQINKAGMMT